MYRKSRYTFNVCLSRRCIIGDRASAVTVEMNPGSTRRHLRRKHTRIPCTGEKRHMFPDQRSRNSDFSLCLYLFPASCPELIPPRRPGSCSRSSQITCISAPFLADLRHRCWIRGNRSHPPVEECRRLSLTNEFFDRLLSAGSPRDGRDTWRRCRRRGCMQGKDTWCRSSPIPPGPGHIRRKDDNYGYPR